MSRKTYRYVLQSINYSINYNLAHDRLPAGIEAHDRYLATSGGESVQLQQGRESGEGNVNEESTTFVIAAKAETNHRKHGIREVQNHARGITGKGELNNPSFFEDFIVLRLIATEFRAFFLRAYSFSVSY